MSTATLEHTNFTAPDPLALASQLCRLFGWHIRWQGTAKDDGFSVHVGSDTSYLAIYRPVDAPTKGPLSYGQIGGLNHLGVVVDDLDAVEERVKAEGLVPHMHGDYEPGRRFYFDTPEGIEIEVVSYR